MTRRRRAVEMRVNEATLRALLRLGDEQRIIGARTEGVGENAVIVLAVDDPHAPAGAIGMRPRFHHHGGPDPISLTEVVWRLRDGTDLVQPAGR